MTRARLSLAIAAAASLAAATLAAAAPSAPPAGATAGPFSHAALDTVLTAIGITLTLIGFTTYIELTIAGGLLTVGCVIAWIRRTRTDVVELPLE